VGANKLLRPFLSISFQSKVKGSRPGAVIGQASKGSPSRQTVLRNYLTQSRASEVSARGVIGCLQARGLYDWRRWKAVRDSKVVRRREAVRCASRKKIFLTRFQREFRLFASNLARRTFALVFELSCPSAAAAAALSSLKKWRSSLLLADSVSGIASCVARPHNNAWALPVSMC